MHCQFHRTTRRLWEPVEGYLFSSTQCIDLPTLNSARIVFPRAPATIYALCVPFSGWKA